MIIPWQELTQDTLLNVLQTFILREGTDYGEYEISLNQKIATLQKKLASGEILLVWSELHESLTLLPADQLPP